MYGIAINRPFASISFIRRVFQLTRLTGRRGGNLWSLGNCVVRVGRPRNESRRVGCLRDVVQTLINNRYLRPACISSGGGVRHGRGAGICYSRPGGCRRYRGGWPTCRLTQWSRRLRFYRRLRFRNAQGGGINRRRRSRFLGGRRLLWLECRLRGGRAGFRRLGPRNRRQQRFRSCSDSRRLDRSSEWASV